MTFLGKYAPSAITVLTLMVFWGQIQNYMMRVNMSILIVAMVQNPVPAVQRGGNETGATTVIQEETCLVANSVARDSSAGDASIQDLEEGPFEWEEFQRGLVLSAFGYGYILTQIIGGRLAERFGVKLIYGLGLFLTGVLTLLSPIVAKWDVKAFIGCLLYTSPSPRDS